MKFLNILTGIATLASSAMFINIPTAMADARTEGFKTPTDNIHCAIYGDGFRCEIKENTAKLPPQPADCNLDWGNAFGMSVTGASARACHGDTIQHPDHPVLGYGKTWRKDGYSCISQRTGLTCTNKSKKGWQISKTKQRLF
jgi:hypothetical protein